MGERLARRILGSTVAAMTLGAPQAARADEPCVKLEADGTDALSREWSDAIEELKRELGRMPTGECRPVTLVLAARQGTVRLVAIGQDGRRAERDLTGPSSLGSTALGLVLSIPSEPPPAGQPGAAVAPPAAAATAAPAAPPASATPGLASLAGAAPAGQAAPAARALHASLGLEAGGRVSAPTAIAMLDIEARADLFLDRWLFLASFRYVPLGLASTQGVDSDVYREIALALGAGRRFPLGRGAALDIAVAPSLLAMRVETDLVPGNETADEFASDIDFRIGGSARLVVPLGARWSLTVTADSDVSPGSVFSPRRIGTLIPFPTWTGGLRLGAAGALL
jgi:hypothetical protein